MPDNFPLFDVPETDFAAVEAMGTKRKFWLYHPQLGKCVFKEATPQTGEDWAEKIACELALLLGLPHAHYELAVSAGRRGVLTPTFIPDHGAFLAGNEILLRVVPDYPSTPPSSGNFYRVSQHTLSNVSAVVQAAEVPFGWTPPAGITSALETFLGYLMLDAWIGNTDRHHENWGMVGLWQSSPDGRVKVTEVYLAPTFDHASSMGRNEPDENRSKRLAGTDPNYTVATYAKKTRSALYLNVGDSKPLHPCDAFAGLGKDHVGAATAWLDRLASIGCSDVAHLFARVPSGRISEPAIEFAKEMLRLNRERLLALRRALP